jgi:soluble lytic murein transglycosylase
MLNILRFALFVLLTLQFSNPYAKPINAQDNNLQKIVKLALEENWSEAMQQANNYPDKSYAYAIVRAIKLYQAPKTFSVGEIIEFFNQNNWLPLPVFAQRVEASIKVDYPSEYIINWYTFYEPTTGWGKFLFLHANIDRKTLSLSEAENLNTLRYYWRNTEFDLSNEEYFLKKYRNYLTIEDCLQKIEFLTWRGKYSYAERLLNILPKKYTSLASLRLMAAKKPDSLFSLISGKTTSERSDEYLQYLYVNKLLENEHEAEALKRLQKIRSTDYPEKWWKLKNMAVRNELREQHYRTAYELASNHGLESGSEFAEAEWLSGWIALRFLKDYDKALLHFDKLYLNTKLANSKSRAAYWVARVYEVLANQVSANEWYTVAAQYPGTFYGHIALGKVHGPKRINYFSDNLKLVSHSRSKTNNAWKLANFALYLYKSGAQKFARQLIDTLPELELSGDEIQDIARLFLENNLYGLAVDLGKTMANKSGILVRAGYPKHIEISNNHLPKGLYLGIIRQESNFNHKAQSGAGAYGLMQLMPATAAKVAKDLGLKRHDYTVDPSLNVLKGVTYINQLHKQYGNLILTVAAYNAGPGSVNKWLKRYGDPRTFSSENQTIDWMESLPFSETRKYIQKVMENFIIYDSLLSPDHSADALIAYLGNK